MSDFKNLLVIEQHKGRAVSIAEDVAELFDYYFIATSVKETEALVREYDLDMILINPFFTDGSGRQFIEILKKNPQLYKTPVIIVSRLPEDKVKLDFYSYGADGFIHYPYDKKELKEKVLRKLHSQKELKNIVKTSGIDIKGFHPRDDFEQIFVDDTGKAYAEGAKGILGLIAPVEIDAIMRDIGMDKGDHLMTSLANLMREHCSENMNATAWTHKLIVFQTIFDNVTAVRERIEMLRQRYLEKMNMVIGEKRQPGFRSVISEIDPSQTLDAQMRKLAGQLINLDKHPDQPPVQLLGETVSVKKHILIFDPDPVSCKIIAYNLKKEGYVPFLMSKLHDILSFSSKDDLAAVIIDTMIPEGGIELVRQIHTASSFADIPIMILSRYGNEDEIAEAFRAGAEDYLMKPLSMVELTARVKRLTE